METQASIETAVFVRVAGPDHALLQYFLQECVEALGVRVTATEADSVVCLRTADAPATSRPTIVVEPDRIRQLADILTLGMERRSGHYDRLGRILPGDSTLTLRGAPVSEFRRWLETMFHASGVETPGVARRPVAVLSHDVDKVSSLSRYGIPGKLVHLGKAMACANGAAFARQARSLGSILAGRNTYWNFERFMELESSLGFRSTFFFLFGRQSLHGARYSLEAVADIIRTLHRGGWEIGLHINPHHAGEADMRSQRQELEDLIGEGIHGARYHGLRFDPSHSYERLQAAGFRYDSSLGFRHHPGFRAGLADAFRPFDQERGCALRLLELPLMIMDTTLFEHLGLDAEQAWSETERLLRYVREQRGVITILWHSNVLEDPIFPGWKDVYLELLRYLKHHNYEVMLGRDLWRARHGGVQGPGSSP